MGDERISRVVAELAASAGAGLARRHRGGLVHLLQRLRALARKPERHPIVFLLDTDPAKPRDVDDSINDSNAQKRRAG